MLASANGAALQILDGFRVGALIEADDAASLAVDDRVPSPVARPGQHVGAAVGQCPHKVLLARV